MLKLWNMYFSSWWNRQTVNEHLLKAVSNGNYKYVQELLSEGADVNLIDAKGRTTLIIAIEGGFWQLCDILIQQEIQLHASDNDGRTALYLCSFKSQVLLVDYLLKNGCDANVSTTEGYTPLMAAAALGDLGIAKLLIKNNARVDTKNENGETALIAAVKNWHINIAKLLINHKAQIDLQENHGLNALHIAVHNGDINMVELLLMEGCSMNMATNDGITALVTAVHVGSTYIPKLLLEYKVDVKKQDLACALHTATDPEQLCVIEVVLQYVIETNVTNVTTNNDWTPLTIAALKSDIHTARLQMEPNAENDLKNEEGNTAFGNDCNVNTTRDGWWKAPIALRCLVLCFFCLLKFLSVTFKVFARAICFFIIFNCINSFIVFFLLK